tara:strand:+ start:71 stop:427 length:357 start_codon:yes stop_codon:yes gene_type:complete
MGVINSMEITEKLIRRSFASWQKNDRDAIEALLAPDFTFTSPYDDCIDRATYFQNCWPHSNKIDSFSILNLISQGNACFVRYRCTLTTGETFENTEYFETNGQQIVQVIVFFGSLPTK